MYASEQQVAVWCIGSRVQPVVCELRVATGRVRLAEETTHSGSNGMMVEPEASETVNDSASSKREQADRLGVCIRKTNFDEKKSRTARMDDHVKTTAF